MKLNILSDLHLGQGALAAPRTDADAVVLAGDIGRPEQAVAWVAGLGKPVLYVPGNHDFYGASIAGTLARLKQLCAGTAVRVLSDEQEVIAGIPGWSSKWPDDRGPVTFRRRPASNATEPGKTAMTTLHPNGVSAAPAASDLELATSAVAGDALAFELIVRRYNRLLFRSARGVVPDDAEAQDVVQETWLRAFGKLHTFRGEAALGTWLARMAINLAISSQRRKGRLVQLHDDATIDQAMDLPNLPANESPDASAERGEMRTLLQASIEGLPPIYRSVFMLRAVEDMSVEESAFCLGVSQDVVKTRFLRARALLREELATRIETGGHDIFAFAGARCDAVLAHVMGELQRQGLLRRP